MTELSPYIVAPTLAWIVAQVTKYIVQGVKAKSFKDVSFLYKSGNMPSSHSALMLSLLTVVGALDGIGSVTFGITLVLSSIIIYDAVNVRRAVGEQGLILLELAKKAGVKQPFHRALGHRITEVTAGSLIGILAGVVVLQLL